MKRPEPNSWLEIIPPYTPGLSKDEIALKYGVKNPIKMASNENPLGPSPKAIEVIKQFAATSHLYPDPKSNELRDAASVFFKVSKDNIIAGNGSDEIIDLICRAYLKPGDEVIIPSITFSFYRIAAQAAGATVVVSDMNGFDFDIDSMINKITSATKIIFLANPNNPTGTYTDETSLSKLIEAVPGGTILFVDEAYADFTRAADFTSAIGLFENKPNVFIIKTLSKSHGMAGVRIGFGIGAKDIIDNLNRIRQPFNVSLLAIKSGTAALNDYDFLDKSLKVNWDGLDFLYSEFKRLGLDYVETQTNFVLVKIGEKSSDVYEKLLKKGIIVRYMKNIPDYLRISVGLAEENKAFISALEESL